MKTIWKYEFIASAARFEIPIGAEILTIQTQHERPCIWALVDPNVKTETRYFESIGTGHDIDEDAGIKRTYIGTLQMYTGLVLHIFEMKEQTK